MAKQPDTVPHPDSVVVPPEIDPKMAVNPDEPPNEQSVGGPDKKGPEPPFTSPSP